MTHSDSRDNRIGGPAVVIVMKRYRVKSRIDGKLVHPGRILLESFLEPFEISQNGLARALGMPPRRINEIVLGKRAITVKTALGLAEMFGPSAHWWMALQADYDIERLREDWTPDIRPTGRRFDRGRFLPQFGYCDVDDLSVDYDEPRHSNE
jgi:addiction module HigA family antidote